MKCILSFFKFMLWHSSQYLPYSAFFLNKYDIPFFHFSKGVLWYRVMSTKRMNFYNHHNSVSFKSHSISVAFKFCAVLVALCAIEPHSTDSLGTQHCAFESHSNSVNFETNAISITSSIHAHSLSNTLKKHAVWST